MRFSGERTVPGPTDVVWASLHDHDVLRAIVPGCSQMVPLGDGTYTATLEARVGRVADTYRGTFSIADVRRGTELRVRVLAGGRFGRLEVDLYVTLTDAAASGATMLRYDAEASVSGLVSRLGRPALTLTGSHFTSCFFRDLERTVRGSRTHSRVASLA